MRDLLARIGLVALVFLAGLLAGLKLQAWRVDARDKAAIERELSAERLEGKRLAGIAYDIGQALGHETQARAAADRRHRAEINSWRKKGVVHVACESGQPATPVAESEVGFGSDFIGAWDRGLCLALPTAEREACRARGTEGAVTGAGVSPAELLANSHDNALALGACLDRHRAWQDWAARVAP